MRIRLIRLFDRLRALLLPPFPPPSLRYNPVTDLLYGLHRWALSSTADVHSVGVVDLPRILPADVLGRLTTHGGTNEAFRVALAELGRNESRLVSPEGETVFWLSNGNIAVKVLRRRHRDTR